MQAPTPTAVPLSTGGLRVAHAWLEEVDQDGIGTTRGAVDTVVSGVERYAVYRVRFQVVNDGDAPLVVDPVLAWGDGAQPVAWSRVPVVDPAAGVPFYAASDPGRSFVATATPITIDALRLGASSTDPSAIAVAGTSSAGLNPAPLVRLPGHSYTEVEFAVRATRDAGWLAAYAFRLEDAAGALDGGPAARVVLRSQPSVQLTPGQRSGVRVADPLPRYPLRGSELVGTTAVTASSDPAGLAGLVAASAFTSPHMNYSLTTDACAACHASHTGQNRMLLRQPAAQATQCLTCHDGSGADSDVASSWSDPTLPANDPATSSWFAHPATTPSDHDTDRDEEFGGLLDRHAECADCHQPHLADATPPIGTVAGWTASGAIRGASGVAVTNGVAGTAPAYTWQPTSSYEYELCFKCHSGYTQLPAQDPLRPSRWALDKAVELNPANVSYHPVEAPGKNQTSAMALSLSGTSPAKLWVFDTTSTVRCLNCHGDADLADPANPPTPDARLDNHAGPNRGLLIAPYRDRDLKPASQPYAATDFALCYACHAEAPMVDAAGDARADTNFSYHGFHLTSIDGVGPGGLDIDVDGAGQGNAVCAECHFRTHGTSYAVDGQAPAAGLVNFAPAVQPYNGTISFVPASGTTPGTCTLTCHGKPHDGYTYQAAP